jgi:ABC-type transport system involved in multi-copper enzyme maturation permease subunit
MSAVAAPPSGTAAARAVVGFAFAESLRRRVFAIVAVLTLAFLLLYGVGVKIAFDQVESRSLVGSNLVDEQTLVGSTVFGLAMFATLFLGAVLAVFLTIGVVRGDAENGLLQPLVVRPVGRATMLIARWVGAAGAAGLYTLVVYAIALALTVALGDWTPDHVVVPGVLLASSSVVIAAISVLASVFMASTAQGIAVFMIFGAGLVAGLLGQIADAIESGTLDDVATAISYALPFEALYQQGLYLLTADTIGLTGTIVQLGPFGGGQQAGVGLGLWAIVYTAGVVGLAVAGFRRRDL